MSDSCNPMDCSLSGSSVHGILQERIPEWAAISFSRESSWLRNWNRSPALQTDSLPTELWRKPLYTIQFSSVQLLIRVRFFATPWTTALQASLSITNSQNSPKPMSIQSVMPFNHLILCCLLLLPSIFPSIRVFSNESALHIKWLKYWNFSFNISPSNEHPGLISFGMDLDLLAVQGTLKSLPMPQFKRINSLALRFLYSPTLTFIHDD